MSDYDEVMKEARERLKHLNLKHREYVGAWQHGTKCCGRLITLGDIVNVTREIEEATDVLELFDE